MLDKNESKDLLPFVSSSVILLEPSTSAVNQNLSLVKDCMLSVETCQILIDQSIRHSGYMHRDIRHSDIRHFGFRHSGPHPVTYLAHEYK